MNSLKKIKQLLIEEQAVNRLPKDLNQLNENLFLPAIKPYLSVIETIRSDAAMALSGEWDKSDNGFVEQIALIDRVLDGQPISVPVDPRMDLFQNLLRDALHALNQIPNTLIRSRRYRNTYEVASNIRQAINH